ncbi:MAG: DUF6357 family protein [Patescibacteria group bacterium]
MTDIQEPQRDVVFSRKNGWMPQVVRKDDDLYIELGAGATANHEPRTFSFPVSQNQLEVIKNDFNRHLLLWSAILPLCDAAGTEGPLDEDAAKALLDPILLGSEHEVEVLLNSTTYNKVQLVTYHANPTLLEKGEIFAAMQTVTQEPDSHLAAEYFADLDRARREVVLSDLDAAILKYTNQYLYRSGIPSRKPEAVDPELLPSVLEVIATAERACVGMEFTERSKEEWQDMTDKVEKAIRAVYPTLVNDAVRTVSYLMCSEESKRYKARTK